jgi:hypothetical protein
MRKQKVRLFPFFVIMLFVLQMSVDLYGAASIWGLSGGIEIPYPQVESGFSYSIIGDTKSYNYNKTLGSLAEISVIKSSNPDFLNDKIRVNAKLRLWRTAGIFPGICVGVYNLNMNKQDRVLFVSAKTDVWLSGTSFVVGATRDDAGIVTPFYGVEQSLFGFFSLVGEKFRNKINVGLRIKPMQGLNLDIFVKDWENGKKKLSYNVSLMVRY